MAQRIGENFIELDRHIGSGPSPRERVHAEWQRTGIAAVRLLKDAGDLPEGLSVSIVQNWLRRTVDHDHPVFTARKSHFDYAMARWQRLPDRSSVRISDEHRRLMKRHCARTAVEPFTLLRGAADRPGGLTSSTVSHWLSGKIKTARIEHLEYVLGLWSALPDAPVLFRAPVMDKRSHLAPVTGELRERFRAEIRRTGVTAQMLMPRLPDRPKGMNAAIINRWIGGTIRRAPQAHIDYALAQWIALPDYDAVHGQLCASRSRHDAVDLWIPFTTDMQADILEQFERKGMTPERLLEGAPNRPDKPTLHVLRGWIYGQVKSTRLAHWTFVLERLATMQDAPQPGRINERRPNKIAANYPDHRPITDAERSALRAHRQRTGIGGSVLLDKAADKPKGLSAAMVGLWLTGKTRTADPSFIAYVLTRYERLPDRAKSRTPKG
ncbi:MAG TPA: hypothetical protein VJM34_14345 [Novosphingobium sp.]|nr:hypothetical protein [Novosphingobium sp.]